MTEHVVSAIIRRPWRSASILGVSIGVIVAALLMSIAWQHNAQGEIHDGTSVHWGYWLGIGGSWFAVAFAVVTLALGTVLSATRTFLRKRRGAA